MNIQTYLFFDGRCAEAVEFYADVFGAETAYLLKFKDGPKELMPDGFEEKVLHATLRFGDTAINLADVPSAQASDFAGFALLVHFDAVETADRAFGRLSAGGRVVVPFEETFWARRYGIVEDRYGMTWKLQVNHGGS